MTDSWWAQRPVLVTGGAGFIGSHLTDALIAKGAKVSVLDCADSPDRLQPVMDRITYLHADAVAWDLPAAGTERFDVIYHLAAFSMLTAAERSPELTYRQNVMGIANMLRIARRCAVTKFIFTSAGGLYTNVPKYLPIDEQHPIDPAQGVYVMTKRIGEFLCEEFHRQYGVPSVVFRLFNTYGPRQSADFLIPALIKEACERGTITVRSEQVRRDFTFVQDMVEALLKGAESDFIGGPVNLGTGTAHGLGDVAEHIARLLGAKVQCLHQPAFGPSNQVCNNARARQVLNWQPAVSLEQGLAMTVNALKEQFAVSPT